MSADLSLKIDTPAESIEALAKEAEALKTKLEEERQKLNDVACKYCPRNNFSQQLFHYCSYCQIVLYFMHINSILG